MLKRIAVTALVVAFISLAAAPETLAQSRCRRDGSGRTVATNYYSPYGYRGVSSQRYYSQPYYNGASSSRYYGRYNNHSTRNLVLSVVAPAAVGAGIGAIAGGGKGAGIGAAIGGGGGALFYLLKHHGRRY